MAKFKGVDIFKSERDALIEIRNAHIKARRKQKKVGKTISYRPFVHYKPNQRQIYESEEKYIKSNFNRRRNIGNECSFMVKDNHVVGLNIFDSFITRVPEAVSRLSHLQWVCFDICAFGADAGLERLLPAENLQILSLDGAFTEEVTCLPDVIGKFTSLRRLILDFNYFITLPESIGNLKHLTHLSANSNLEFLPESIGSLTSLKKLNLYDNKIPFLPKSIGNLKNLQIMDLRRNKLRFLPESIGNLQNLKILSLHDNEIKKVPENIGNLSQLEILNLSKNNLKDIPESISQLPMLKSLDLSHNHLTYLPHSISNLTSLKILDLAGNQFTYLPYILKNLRNCVSFWAEKNPGNFRDLERYLTRKEVPEETDQEELLHVVKEKGGYKIIKPRKVKKIILGNLKTISYAFRHYEEEQNVIKQMLRLYKKGDISEKELNMWIFMKLEGTFEKGIDKDGLEKEFMERTIDVYAYISKIFDEIMLRNDLKAFDMFIKEQGPLRNEITECLSPRFVESATKIVEKVLHANEKCAAEDGEKAFHVIYCAQSDLHEQQFIKFLLHGVLNQFFTYWSQMTIFQYCKNIAV